MKRILFFGSQITTGGAQKTLLDQARWFHAAGYDVRVVFYYDKDGQLKRLSACSLFPIDVLTSDRRPSFSNLIPAVFRLFSFLRRAKPDCIECFTHDANLIGLPVAWMAGVPRRVGSHHGQFERLNSVTKWIHAKMINSSLASCLVCVSERAENQAKAEGVSDTKLVRIPNGIELVQRDGQVRADMRVQLGVDSQELMVLSVGRLVPEKAQSFLVQAAEVALSHNAEMRFFIAGDGVLRDALQAQIDVLGISFHFQLLGNRDDVAALLNAADLFVLYSETEGLPLSMMEAMSVGLPVIASDLEGSRELLTNPEAGILVPFGDAHGLTDALLTLSHAPERMKILGERGAQKIKQHYTLEQSCLLYRDLFFPDRPEQK